MINNIIEKIFIGFALVVLFGGEITFQFNNANEQTISNLHKQEKAEIDSVLIREDVLAEKRAADLRAKPIELTKARLDSLTKAGRGPYITGMINLDRQIEEVRKPYKELVERLQAPIRVYYADRRGHASGWLSKFSGIQFGVVPSIAAVLLAILAARWPYASWQFVVLAVGAFIAQGMACIIIYHGAMLRLGEIVESVGISVMFFFCAPLAYHFGTKAFKEKKPADKHKIERGIDRQPELPKRVEHSGNGSIRTVKLTVGDIWDELPKPTDLESAKKFLRLLILSNQYKKGDQVKLANMIGVNWESALRRTLDRAKKDYSTFPFDLVRSEVSSLMNELKSEAVR